MSTRAASLFLTTTCAFAVACGGPGDTGQGSGGHGGASVATTGPATTSATTGSTSHASSGPGGAAGSAGSSGGGGAGGGAGASCPSPVAPDARAAERAACAFHAGAKATDTLELTEAERLAIPIKHLVIVMEENRSFDHYFGELAGAGQPGAEGWPAGFTNPDTKGAHVAPYHLASPCLPGDPPHQGSAMHAGWDNGKMDGFVKSAAVGGSNGHYVMGYYDAKDLPFYYWLASTFAMSDRYFAATLGGTWANRDYLYAGTSDGVTDTGQAVINAPTIFEALTKASVSWGVYTDGTVRQNSLGWTNAHAGVATFAAFLAALEGGTLPAVSFVDPGPGQDEHPAANIHGGEAWARTMYTAAFKSPLWPTLAILHTYDESGGLADHVPSPVACLASPDQTAFGDLGVRVPFVVVSPWARPHFVSHRVHEHSSALRLIEVLHGLPALTGRDANAAALLDLFDFGCPALTTPGVAPAAGTSTCP